MATSSKQIGDRVRITAGQHKNQVGILVGKERRGWQVELESGERATIHFPQVQLLQEKDNQNPPTVEPADTEVEPSELNADGEVTVSFSLDDINRAKTSSETTASTETTAEACETAQTDSSEGETVTSEVSETPQVDTDDISKLNVKELWAQAKQRGISVARTRDDFLHIILQKNPEADPAQLRGKVLFDTVTAMHISRLRTKQDLLKLLTA